MPWGKHWVASSRDSTVPIAHFRPFGPLPQAPTIKKKHKTSCPSNRPAAPSSCVPTDLICANKGAPPRDREIQGKAPPLLPSLQVSQVSRMQGLASLVDIHISTAIPASCRRRPPASRDCENRTMATADPKKKTGPGKPCLTRRGCGCVASKARDVDLSEIRRGREGVGTRRPPPLALLHGYQSYQPKPHLQGPVLCWVCGWRTSGGVGPYPPRRAATHDGSHIFVAVD